MQKWKALAVALPLICAVFVVGWFVICVKLGFSAYADRGGAVGVMLSFAALFLLSTDRYHSIDVLDKNSEKFFSALSAATQDDASFLSERNSARIDAIKYDLKRARMQTNWENASLAISSVISTLFWGFGDIMAQWFL